MRKVGPSIRDPTAPNALAAGILYSHNCPSQHRNMFPLFRPGKRSAYKQSVLWSAVTVAPAATNKGGQTGTALPLNRKRQAAKKEAGYPVLKAGRTRKTGGRAKGRGTAAAGSDPAAGSRCEVSPKHY